MRRTRRTGRLAPDSGATMVEFALTFPVVVILMFGIMEMAWLTLHFSEVWSVAREGARHAVTVGDSNDNGVANFADCGDIRVFALGRASVSGVGGDDVAITYLTPGGTVYDCQGGTPPPTDIDPGTQVTVTVSVPYDALGIPIVGPIFDGMDIGSASTRSVQSGWRFG